MTAKVLDACCGSKMFYFSKNDPNVLYVDNRKVENEIIWTSKDGSDGKTRDEFQPTINRKEVSDALWRKEDDRLQEADNQEEVVLLPASSERVVSEKAIPEEKKDGTDDGHEDKTEPPD